MNNYYGTQLSQEEMQRRQALLAAQQQRQRNQPPNVNIAAANAQSFAQMGPMSAMSDAPMTGADSLDDIIRENSQQIHRRRSLPQSYNPNNIGQGDADRRISMLNYNQDPNNPFKDFRFDGMGAQAGGMQGNFSDMDTSMGLGDGSGGFGHPGMMQLPPSGDFANISSEMMGNMMAFSNLNMNTLQNGPNSAADMFNSSDMNSQFNPNVLNAMGGDFSMDTSVDSVPMSASSTTGPTPFAVDAKADDSMLSMDQGFDPQDVMHTPHQQSNPGAQGYAPSVPTLSRETSNATSFQSPASAQSTRPSMTPTTSSGVGSGVQAGPQPPPDIKTEKSIYSKSGFDMIRALYYVAARPNPEVQLGAVDMSCAFVVCDVSLNDCPIVYVSDNFQNLTGYSRHDIMGQNCRFLQAPDGNVEAGTKREFVENSAVYNLKKKIHEGKEVQQSLINYRKGGKPFLNLLTMIPIPWDTKDIRYFVGFQIDLVECPDAISGQEMGGVQVNYKHSDIGQYIWTPPNSSQWEPENGQTLGVDDVSTLLQQYNPKGVVSDWHKQSWDKMLLENTDDVVHVLSLKGLFLYLSPSCRKILEYDTNDLVGNSLSSICHPSDIVPVTRELKDTQAGSPVNIVFRIRRKQSGYTWFESHGSLFVEQGKGRKCIILVGRKRPVFALHRRDLEANGGIGDSEMWTKLSTSGMFLYVSSNVRSLLDLQPDQLEGTSIQDLMRKETRPEFGRCIEKARRGKIVTCKHEVQNRRCQVLQAQTVLYPGDAGEGQKPTFVLAQTRLIKASSRHLPPPSSTTKSTPSSGGAPDDRSVVGGGRVAETNNNVISSAASKGAVRLGNQDEALASDDNIFDELKTTRCTSWQYELRQMEKINRILAEELVQLLTNKKKRKRRKGVGNIVRDCANCHTRNTPEWRRGPSGQRDLCNSCGLRWAKQMKTGRVSPRNSSRGGNGDTHSRKSNSPLHSSPLHHEASAESGSSVADGSSKRPSHGHSRSKGGNSPIDNGTINPAGLNAPMPSAYTGNMPPPQSQPHLAGGRGVSGTGMAMASIREE
ncbi:uncharacterized protein E0L32_009186 [Thyridium curvatum]|uniref:White collar 1 protein n=1 Tax=Thyridium curvatum TaxID=1093900 RepID=A0A507AHT6_9PEZI|nr:uncharacterized protein E0L32_009186 [Thyridium curvatum]TPX09585.1 hypothetical protein E0L32_009186 [Thyridium curvatum]